MPTNRHNDFAIFSMLEFSGIESLGMWKSGMPNLCKALESGPLNLNRFQELFSS